jgi:hypothetical protein
MSFGSLTVLYSEFALDDPEDLSGWTTDAQVVVGRNRIIDRWQPSEVTITLLDPNPVATLRVGGYLTVKGIGFVIVSISRTYGIPYNSTTHSAPQDIVVLNALSTGLKYCGQIKYQDETLTANTLKEYAYTATGNISGGGAPVFSGSAWDTFTAKLTNFSGSGLDLLNGLVNGVVGYVQDPGTFNNVIFQNPLNLGSSGIYAANNHVNFTDSGAQSSATNTYHFDEIQFLATTENDYGVIIVTYNVGANVVTAGSAGPEYQTNTLLNTGSQAQQMADVLAAILASSEITPYSISTKASITDGFDQQSQTQYDTIGTRIGITFRGTTYNAICEGFTISQTVNDARYTYYLSPALAQPLILDDTNFGILDTNTLGIG